MQRDTTLFELLFFLAQSLFSVVSYAYIATDYVYNLVGCEFTECLRVRAPSPAPAAVPTSSPTVYDDGSFSIKLVNMGTSTDWDAEFYAAALRWEQVIKNDQPNVVPEYFGVGGMFGRFFDSVFSEEVDDLTIGYEVSDRLPGGVLGRAGPRFVRKDTGTTIVGVMQFDANFFARGSSADNLMIILHEMGHVLGLGTRWDNARCDSGCKPDGASYTYTCRGALEAYQELNLFPPQGTGTILKVSNDGGSASACGHWDDESFNHPYWSEIMTPFFNPRKKQLISAVSVASLADIGGYEVDISAADPIPTTSTTSLLVDYGLLVDREIDLTIEVIEEIEPEYLDMST